MARREILPLAKPIQPSRNYFPLLVVFIVIVCLAAGLALAFASDNLDPTQRWTLIGFLILFSVCGLVFSLFGSAFSEWLTMREYRKFAAGENDRQIVWDVMPPTEQRQKLTGEVYELAQILEIPPEQMSDLLSAYVVAEDLALRQIQQEEKKPLMRHVSIGGADFDGVFLNQDLITCVEVTFLVSPHFSQDKINRIIKKIGDAKQVFNKLRPNSKIKLLMVLVTQLDKREERQLRSSLNGSRFPETPVDIDIRLKDFEELQKIYAM
jgi:hypothetical protein